ncbi:MAG: tyrosine--tRNA ligase [uncultured DHVE6 group euryarchaeote]|jgi:tyrosyl-tRNA synthetase|nr:MAG: tyrosine--tRNA ligase [uncultured DHVE6 group euryarchaeote]
MKKLDLILRNTQEVIKCEELEKLLRANKKPVVYLGAAPSGKINISYFLQAIKLKDFMDSGFKVKYLLADLHAYLDDRKSPWELIGFRAKYYQEAMTGIFKAIGADPRKVKFVLGSDIQTTKKYAFDLYKLMGQVNITRANRASSGVVRQVSSPDLGSLNYALMQAIDVHHIGADVAFSGIDQRKIYMLAREEVAKLGHKKPICVFSPLIPGLRNGKKMSASDPNAAILLSDDQKTVIKKINKAHCPIGIVEDNGVLALAKYMIFPVINKLVIERPEKFGGNLAYKNYEQLERDYKAKNLHPADLKSGIASEINKLLVPVQKHLNTKQALIKKAYPK